MSHHSPYPGNHESDNMNKLYGFEGEVTSKYSSQMMALFSEVFDWLPLAHCMHRGQDTGKPRPYGVH